MKGNPDDRPSGPPCTVRTTFLYTDGVHRLASWQKVTDKACVSSSLLLKGTALEVVSSSSASVLGQVTVTNKSSFFRPVYDTADRWLSQNSPF